MTTDLFDSDVPRLVRQVWLTLLVKASGTTGVVDIDRAELAAFVTQKGGPIVSPSEVDEAIEALGPRVESLRNGRYRVPHIRSYFRRHIAAATEGSADGST
jgi:hypothetical protein